MGEVRNGMLSKVLAGLQQRVDRGDYPAYVGWLVFKAAAKDAGCLDVGRTAGSHGPINLWALWELVRAAEEWLTADPEEDVGTPEEGLLVEDALRLAGLRRDLGPLVAEVAARERDQNSLWIRVVRECRIKGKGRVGGRGAKAATR